MAERSSYDVYHDWRHKHWTPHSMHVSTKIESAVYERVMDHEGDKLLIAIIDNPTKALTAEVRASHDDCEMVRAAGKTALLVWEKETG